MRAELTPWRPIERPPAPVVPSWTSCWLDTTNVPGDPARGRSESERVLVAESCWARSFRSPSAAGFARWLFGVLPLFVIMQLMASRLELFQKFFRIMEDMPTVSLGVMTPRQDLNMMKKFAPILPGVVAYYAGFVARVSVILILAALLPVVVVLGFLPFLRIVRQGVIGLLGDAYAALAEPAARAGMIAQINGDVDWCLRHADRLVVVAHSQGAMLAREALAERPRGDRVVLVGQGSGLGMLHGLRVSARMRLPRFGWLLLGAYSAVGVVTAFALYTVAKAIILEVTSLINAASAVPAFMECAYDGRTDCFPLLLDPFSEGFSFASMIPPTLASLAVLVAGLVFVKLLDLLGVSISPEDLLAELKIPSGGIARWLEFSSRYDPVSCGPLLVGCADEVVDVTTGYSLPGQHSGYRKHPVVLARLAGLLSVASTTPAAPVIWPEQLAHVEAAARRRALGQRLALRIQVLVSWAVLVAPMWLFFNSVVGR
jgi:hypothetical protein